MNCTIYFYCIIMGVFIKCILLLLTLGCLLMQSKIEKMLIGEPLKTEELSHEKFNVFWGLPILSSDAISSVAYAGEAILIALIPILGGASYKYMVYVSLIIVLLLFMLVFSYRQTIDSYPNGGGSYIVAKDNLGTIPGLTAGAALSIDYVLTVAVSISSGTAAITSAFPSLFPYRVIICLVLILFMTIGNLRGLKDSSKMFGIPTYLFILTIAVMIITGIVKNALGIPPSTDKIPGMTAVLNQQMGTVSIVLLLKAFASGCTALTGVEAVSNGIPNFKAPSQKHAKTVLMLLGGVVLFMFGGISFLAKMYLPVPDPKITVVAQIAAKVFGLHTFSFMFYLVQITTAFILIMAANTAYADLPLLLSLIAKDGFAPRQFAKRGKRLSFSNGIILLCIGASTLIIVFHGLTNDLLPLYAVGVFLSFTLSQTGMLTRWFRLKTPGWKHKAVINGFGAFLSFLTVTDLAIDKFMLGAWVVCLMIPFLVLVMLRIKKHYSVVAEQLKLTADVKPKDISFIKQKQYVIVPIDTLNKSFIKALNYARTISDNIIVFHISVDDEATKRLQKKWEEFNVGIPMVVKKSPFREVINVLCDYIDSEEYAAGPKDTVTVVMPQFKTTKWWHNVLHNQTSMFIRSSLMKKRNIAVITVPYIIEE